MSTTTPKPANPVPARPPSRPQGFAAMLIRAQRRFAAQRPLPQTA